jgi:hypothetical protein
MKSLLIILLFAISLCLEDDKLSSWKKYNITKEDPDLNSILSEAFSNYTKRANNIDLKIDDIFCLTAYTQLANGMNFKITFIDRKADFPAIQEYKINKRNQNNGESLEIFEVNEYDESTGLIKFDEPQFTEVENQLYKFLKKNNIKLLYISYVYPIENDETKFFIINADTDDGQNLFIIGFDKAAKKYDFCVKLK